MSSTLTSTRTSRMAPPPRTGHGPPVPPGRERHRQDEGRPRLLGRGTRKQGSRKGPAIMTAYSADQTSGRVGRTNVQKAAAAVGIVFLLVGVLGFIPGITSNYDQLEFASADSDALLLGIFQVSILHNIVHLLFGVLGLVMARTASGARTYLVVGGIVYLVLFLYGLLV